ncbi:hypothetical protein CSUI_009863 [Cystoisospora suis]|uniref:Transmembrane protein n=1 Tax=Cystoisospora suis TaxID=483139 RepID=A0A2C6KIV3_9APIC|nr:hypothetical protein CSUI_009863 [Cystoisospora suis]
MYIYVSIFGIDPFSPLIRLKRRALDLRKKISQISVLHFFLSPSPSYCNFFSCDFSLLLLFLSVGLERKRKRERGKQRKKSRREKEGVSERKPPFLFPLTFFLSSSSFRSVSFFLSLAFFFFLSVLYVHSLEIIPGWSVHLSLRQKKKERVRKKERKKGKK